ncbi:MAG: DUF2793 domain-containing protein [Erythrobacter sp.]
MNQSFSMIDALIKGQVLASQVSPPANPEEGSIYRVTETAMDDWAGYEDHLAIRIAGAWHFAPPYEGLATFDLNESSFLIFRNGWISLSAPTSPQGGAIADLEARAAIDALIATLSSAGILK